MKLSRVVLFVLLVLATMAPSLTAAGAVKAGITSTNSVSGTRAGPAAARPALVDQTLSYPEANYRVATGRGR